MSQFSQPVKARAELFGQAKIDILPKTSDLPEKINRSIGPASLASQPTELWNMDIDDLEEIWAVRKGLAVKLRIGT